MPITEFKFIASRRYLVFLGVMLFGCMIVIVGTPVSWPIKLIALLVMAIYGGNIVWRYGLLRSRKSILGVRKEFDDSWTLLMPDQEIKAELRGDSTVTGVLSILRFKVPGQYFALNCIVLPDSLSINQYRALLVRCRVD